MNQLFKEQSVKKPDYNNPGSANECFHCGEPIPEYFSQTVVINGKSENMCCPGCAAVAQTIVNTGMADFYNYRTEKSNLINDEIKSFLDKAELYESPVLEQHYVDNLAGDQSKAFLHVSGVTCAACIWLIEKTALTVSGVLEANLNFATSILTVTWDSEKTNLSNILKAVAQIGYVAQPVSTESRSVINKRKRNDYLRRIGVAFAFAMQVMILSVALYLGEYTGMESGTKTMFIYLAMILTLPVLFYSGQGLLNSFFQDLRYWRITVNIPIGLGLLLAFAASISATVSGSGQVYYDSIVMFVTLLLSARFLEYSARSKAQDLIEPLICEKPDYAIRLIDNVEQKIPDLELELGDVVLVRSGEKIPADGVILQGRTNVDESIITGESKTLIREPGDRVYSGSINYGSTIQIKVDRIGQQTMRSLIAALAEKAQTHKPGWLKIIDRIASKFVLTVLFVALLTALYWLNAGSEQWLAITISVLIITCPCALSLATPLAMSLSLGRLTRQGILIANAQVLETVNKVRGVVLDKTGTLTKGHYSITNVRTLSDIAQLQCLQIAQSLEYYSAHPIANAFKVPDKKMLMAVDDWQVVTGYGVSGRIGQQQYFVGSEEFIKKHSSAQIVNRNETTAHVMLEQNNSIIYLADTDSILCEFELSDSLREEARELIEFFKTKNFDLVILSGDSHNAVKTVAQQLGINQYYSRQTPDSKLDFINQKQKTGDGWIMIGDGVNDAPVLKAAAISIAPKFAQDYASANADVVLLNNNLLKITDFFQVSTKTRQIIKQNIAWALIYNLIALPLAVGGMVMPWIAASGMALSSLIVTLNSLRISISQKQGK